MICFNVPPYLGVEEKYIHEAVMSHKICGDGAFTNRCSEYIEKRTKTKKALLTTSCTHALEMAALLSDIKPGDEILMPSFTFVSTANAFVLRGARIKFIDIRPDTMNIDEKLLESAITKKTRVIAPVHYAGVACEMDTIMGLAKAYNLRVIEDAAQAVGSSYKGSALGSIGDYGCFSFHETKNLSMGEGGALLIRDSQNVERAEIIREKGTNRRKFLRGEIDKYTWVETGSSYLPSELNAAYLYGQLENAELIINNRMKIWEKYYHGLHELCKRGLIEVPYIPLGCGHNAHMFYIKCADLDERTRFIAFMKELGISTVFHYVPLHSSPAGIECGDFVGTDRYTTRESERLVRLPLYYNISEEDVDRVIDGVYAFYHVSR